MSNLDVNECVFVSEFAELWGDLVAEKKEDEGEDAYIPDQPTIAELVESMDEEAWGFPAAWLEMRDLAGRVAARYLAGDLLLPDIRVGGFQMFYLFVGDYWRSKEKGEEGQQVLDPESFYTRMFATFSAMQNAIAEQDPEYQEQTRYFLAPVLRAWLARPAPILNPHTNRNGKPTNQILLNLPDHAEVLPCIQERDVETGVGALGTEMLPGFAEFFQNDDLDHPLISLADEAGFAGLRPGRGARLDLRLLIWGMSAMQMADRNKTEHEYTPTLQEIIDILWPSVPGLKRMRINPAGVWFAKTPSFRPGDHGPGLMNALRAVNSAEILLPNGRLFNPMQVWEKPLDLNDRSSRVNILVRIPTSLQGGAAVGKPDLLAAGVKSGPAFWLELGLAYLWDEAKQRNFGNRVYDTVPEVKRNDAGYLEDSNGNLVTHRGKPTKDWGHHKRVETGRRIDSTERARARVRVMDNRGLHRLAFPETKENGKPKTKTQRANEIAKVKELLIEKEKAGRIKIERGKVDDRTGKKGWRIIQRWLQR